LEEFRSRTAQTFALAEHFEIFEILKMLEPIYLELVWDPKFTIHMMPIPESKGHTRATVIDNAVILEVLLDEPNAAERLGVIFHKLSHAAYEAQPQAIQKNLDAWFDQHPSKFALLAKNLLNEGLATALGNGLAYKAITGKRDEAEWYSVEEINLGARGAISLVESYIETSRQIDREFVVKWIKSYEVTFPNALNTTEIRLRESVLILGG